MASKSRLAQMYILGNFVGFSQYEEGQKPLKLIAGKVPLGA